MTTRPIAPWPGWRGETCIVTPASTPIEAVEAVRRFYDVAAERWSVAETPDGYLVTTGLMPSKPVGLPLGGEVWLIDADGSATPYAAQLGGEVHLWTRVRVE